MPANDAAASSINHLRIITKVKRSILPVAFLLYMCSYMDRSTIGYAQLHMSEDLNIDIGAYSTAASIFFVFYVVLEVPSNLVLSRVGARLWLSRIAVSWGVVCVLTGFIWNTSGLYISRIALGIAEAGLFPGLLLYLSFWFLQEDRGRALAALVFAQPVALILGSATGGLILDHVDWFGLESWRWVFILQGLAPVLVGIYALLFLADRPTKARWLTSAEGKWLEERISAENAGLVARERGAKDGSTLQAFRSPRVIALSAIAFLGSVGNYGMAFFLPQVVQQLDPGYSATSIGLVGAIPYICAGIAMLFVGRASDRLKSRRGIVIVCLAIGVVGLVSTMVFRHMPLLGVTSLCILAIGIVSYSPPM
nr:MFS transporter [Streptomyces antimycoticus]